MKELIEYILKSLVTYPDDVKVEEQVLPDGLVIFSISANQEDYGRIIGRQGMLIQALRTIVKARAIKEKRKVMVRVMTDDAPRPTDTPEQMEEQVAEEVVEERVEEEVIDDNLV